ncbi:MAG: hypothetical protein P8Y58_17130 [Novosphingobium sp.]
MTFRPPSSKRALIREADLRRFARISSQEGVTIHSRLDPDGGITITIDPGSEAASVRSGDLDSRLAVFAGS